MFTAENCRKAYTNYCANRSEIARIAAIAYCEEKTAMILEAAKTGWNNIDIRKPSGTQETVDIAKQLLEEAGFEVSTSHNLRFFSIKW